ncbi:efflux RND transporter periplasmic adaptor subunit [Methylocapsa acidiphila]|uniref:efflux RND transporter periplasmic adaptor subunit n=1 Tax=Methylocapsa acidiphila TaxID=133552 RepID=UPI0004040E8F|nr:efflux RND transporter periplasmic adaptor subunit [Methylocapsa acidiphila]
MKRIIIFVLALIFFIGLGGGLGYFQFVIKPQMIKSIISQAAPPPPAVAVEAAKTEVWTPRLPAIGTFHAFQGIDISPQVGGAIVAVRVESGQDVEKGAHLFDIDNSVEQADLKSNLATLKNADFALDRQRQLSISGNTAKANFDAAEATRDTAAAAVERVRATIAQKTLVAPFAGRLGIRKIDLGQYVSPGSSLITLQQLDPIYVDFPVPEKSLDLLKPGETLEVGVDAYPGEIFRGTVKTIDARVAQESRNVLVRGELENKKRRLLPGMFANVNIVAGAPAQVVALPRTAITYSLYGDSVFVVIPAAPETGAAQAASVQASPANDAPVKVERRFVRLGESREDRVAVLEGVRPGELVVIEGQLKLQPNQRVRVDPNAHLEPPAKRPKE